MFNPKSVPTLPYDLLRLISYEALPITRILDAPNPTGEITVKELEKYLQISQSNLETHLTTTSADQNFIDEALQQTSWKNKCRQEDLQQARDRVAQLNIWYDTFVPQIQTPELRKCAADKLWREIKDAEESLTKAEHALQVLKPTTAKDVWNELHCRFLSEIGSYTEEIARLKKQAEDDAAKRAIAEEVNTELRCLRMAATRTT